MYGFGVSCYLICLKNNDFLVEGLNLLFDFLIWVLKVGEGIGVVL